MNVLPWWPIALKEMGVEEVPGPMGNLRILEYLASTTIGKDLAESDETPWCSAFANYCVERAGVQGTNSAWARSWLKWGREWGTGLMTLALDGRSVVPPAGAICVFERGSGGHVGFFAGLRVRWGEPPGPDAIATMEVLGGNQGDRVQVSQYPASRLLGVRVP